MKVFSSSVLTGLKPRVSLVVLPAGGGGVSLFNYPGCWAVVVLPAV